MAIPPPSPHDSAESLYAQARLLHERCEAQRAVIEGIKTYVAPWTRDKRMHILGGMLLREIDRLERAASERAQQDRGT